MTPIESFLLEVALRSTAILLVAFGTLFAWRKASAAHRHFILAIALFIVLLLPAGIAFTPKLVIPLPFLSAPKPTPSLSSFSVAGKHQSGKEETQSSLPMPSTSKTAPIGLVSILLGLLLSGITIRAGFTFATVLSVLRFRRNMKEIVLLPSIIENLDQKTLPPVFISRETNVAMLVGIFRPVIVLPQAAFQWSPEETLMVLHHELAHLHRRDHWMQPFFNLLGIFYWWNPFVWIALEWMRRERECACDDFVLRLRYRPTDYAEMLLESVRSLAFSPRFQPLVLTMARTTKIDGRIRAILRPDADRTVTTMKSVRKIFAIGLLIAAVSFATSCSDQKTIAINQKLDSIVFPKVYCLDAELSSVLDFLRMQSARLDPEKKGINIVLQPSLIPSEGVALQKKKITLVLSDIPLRQVLSFTASAADLKMEVTPYAVVLSQAKPPQSTSKKLDIPLPLEMTANIDRKLDSIILPKLNFKDVTLQEVIEMMNRQSVAADHDEPDPTKKGVKILLRGEPAIGQPSSMNISMKNIPLREALRYIARYADLQIAVAPHAVTLTFLTPEEMAKREANEKAITEQSLDTLILPSVNVKGASLHNAIEQINRQVEIACESDPQKMLFVEIDAPAGMEKQLAAIRITVSRRNVSLRAALEQIAATANMELRVQPDIVLLVPKPKSATALPINSTPALPPLPKIREKGKGEWSFDVYSSAGYIKKN